MSDDYSRVLEVFSPILVEEYIRLNAVANCIKKEKGSALTKFKIKPEHYAKVKNEYIQAPLIGVNLQYDEQNEMLIASVSAELNKIYENKIMNEVAVKFSENYKNRYAEYIKVIE